MRFVNFTAAKKVRVGVEDGGDIVDLIEALGGERRVKKEDRAILADTVSLIAAGASGMRLARRALRESRKTGKGRLPKRGIKLRAPLAPPIILCSGENYWDHREEKPAVEGREPEFFIKTPQGVIGPTDQIRLDRKVTRKLDYETELAIVIGKPGRHIAKKDALRHVFGYVVMNDVTARDRQVRMRPDGTCSYALGPGKNFDTCAPLGPCIVTADEIPNPQRLVLRTTVNGEVRQLSNTRKMIWGVADLVKFFSTFLTLQPGTVISTGTPGGTAWGTDAELGGKFSKRKGARPLSYLEPGDVVTCEIEHIGLLRNKVVLNR